MNFETMIIGILALFSIAGLFRVLYGPTIWDRLLGFNLFSSKIIVIALLIGVLIDRSYVIDVALIYGVLGFIGTIMLSRFVERRGDI